MIKKNNLVYGVFVLLGILAVVSLGILDRHEKPVVEAVPVVAEVLEEPQVVENVSEELVQPEQPDGCEVLLAGPGDHECSMHPFLKISDITDLQKGSAKELSFANRANLKNGDVVKIPMEDGEFLYAVVERIDEFVPGVYNMVGGLEGNPQATYLTTFIRSERIVTMVTDPVNDLGYEVVQERNKDLVVNIMSADDMVPICNPFIADEDEDDHDGLGDFDDFGALEVAGLAIPSNDRTIEVSGSGVSPLVPKLSSKPGSQYVIYLDFDGEVVNDRRWTYLSNRIIGAVGAPINAGPYDLDGNPGRLSNDELQKLYAFWSEVAEDFSPFDVNVTTDFDVFNAAAVSRRHQHVITPTKWFPSGGVAFLGYFGVPSVSWTFWMQAIVPSHEVGHTLGLRHDGVGAGGPRVAGVGGNGDYYRGHGSGSTAWTPIMGSGYNPATWSRGEYTRSNNAQDDVTIITSKIPYQADVHGNTNATAANLSARDVVKNYKIRVGDYYRGNFNRLFFILEDETAAADSKFSNIKVYESGSTGTALNLNSYTLSTYAGHANLGAGSSVQNGGTTLSMAGSVWSDINFSYTVTPNTILEFDFQADVEGEAHAIGFDTNDNFSQNFAFQFLGQRAVGFENFRKDDVVSEQYYSDYYARGVIHSRTDVDVFKYTSAGGNFKVNAHSVNFGNIDVLMKLYSPSGSLIGTSNSVSTRNAEIQVTAGVAGDYFIHVEGTGIGNPTASFPTGYTDYSSIGYYDVFISNATTTVATAPAAPTALVATGVSTTQINVTWTDNSGNEDGFHLERSANGLSGWTRIATLPTNTVTYSNTGLSTCETWHYRVRAYNSTGNSNWSNIDNGTTLGSCGPTIPTAPTSLTATGASTTRIDVTWTDAATNEDGFHLERSLNGVSGWARIATLPANTVNYSNTGLSSCETWHYRVRTYNAAGNSSWSNVDNGTTLGSCGSTAPNAPTSLTASGASTTRIDVTWTDNATNESGFHLERSVNGVSGWTRIATLSANVVSYSNTGLSSCETWHYRVRAYNASGNSNWSNTDSGTTLGSCGPTIPTAPSVLSATGVSSTRIDVSWTDNSTNESGFHLERSPNGVGGWVRIATLTANSVNYSNTGLSACATWHYRVRAYNASGNSNWSNIDDATTSGSCGGSRLRAPQRIAAASTSGSAIRITWADSSDNEDGFIVVRSNARTGGVWTQIADLPANSYTHTDTNVSACEKWYYRIKAYNSSGDSDWSITFGAKAFVTQPGDTWVKQTALSHQFREAALWIGDKFVVAGNSSSTGDIYTSPDGLNWTLRYSNFGIAHMGWNGNMIVAAGLSGVITSPDGINWTRRLTGTYWDAVWNGETFVAVGSSNTQVSTDGTRWTKINSVFNYCVEWNGKLFVAAGRGRNYTTSPDGINWTNRTFPSSIATTSGYSHDLAFDGQNVVIVGNDGRILRSSDGINWTGHRISSSFVKGITWTGNEFFINQYHGAIYSSPDGMTWTRRAAPTSTSQGGMTWNGEMIISVGDEVYTSTSQCTAPPPPPPPTSPAAPINLVAGSTNANLIELSWIDNATNEDGFTVERSSDGTSWTSLGSVGANVTTYSDSTVAECDTWYYRVKAHNSVGDSDWSNVFDATSFKDMPGVNWVSQTSGTTRYFEGVIWANDLFVTVGSGGVFTSPDGVTWTNRHSSSSLWNVCWAGDKFVAIGYFGRIVTSPDGITWTVQTSGTTGELHGVVWTGSQIVVTGANGIILTSPDGVTWASQTSGTFEKIWTVAWSGKVIAGVFGNGQGVIISTDGINWTIVNPGTTSRTHTIAWVGDRFMLTGSSGLIMTSSDGNTWTQQTTGTTSFLYGISWTGSQYVVNGTGGRVLTSTDAVNWTTRNSSSVTSFWGLAWSGDTFVGVGTSGRIHTSTEVCSAPPTAPNAPTNLVAESVNSNLIELSWIDNADNEDGFRLERSSDGVTWSSLGTLSANVRSYSDLTVNDCEEWYYRVRAYNTVGDSDWSNQFSTIAYNDPAGTAWTAQATGIGSYLADVIWAGDKYLAAGESGIYSSPDGATWTARHTGVAYRDICWVGDKYVAVGFNGSIATSVNGTSWTTQTSGTTRNLYAVVWSGKQVVAAGDNGVVLTSSDGATWTVRSSGTTKQIRSIAWNGSNYVASYNGGGSGFVTSSNGINWVAVPILGAIVINEVIWMGDKFVAVGHAGGSNGMFYTSTNGSTWLQRSAIAASPPVAITWGGNQVVAVGEHGTVMTSTNGTSWTLQTSASTEDFWGICWNGSQFLGVTFDGNVQFSKGACIPPPTPPAAPTNLVAESVNSNLIELSWIDNANNEDGFRVERSSDGVAWTTLAALSSNVTAYSDATVDDCDLWYYRVRAHNTLGNSDWSNEFSVIAYKDSAGSVWTDQTTGIGWYLADAIWAGDKYIAVGGRGIHSSPDGATWTARHTGAIYRDICWAGDKYVAVGFNGSIASSTNGISWTQQTSGTTESLFAVVWSGTQLVAAGMNGTILTSPDGVAWTPRVSGITKTIRSIAWNGTTYVACYTSGGGVVTSSNGINWATVPIGGSGLINEVIWMGDKFVAVGQSGSGMMYTSADGSTWTSRSSGNIYELEAVTWAGNQVVAVGDRGTVFTSTDGNSWTLQTTANTEDFWGVCWNGAQFMGVTFSGNVQISKGACIPPPPPPAQPINLIATGVSTNQIDVTWIDQATAEDGYMIERSADGVTGWVQLGGILPKDSVSYVDTSVDKCETWYYRVHAFNSSGLSRVSNVDDGTTFCPGVATNPPIDLTSASQHSRQVVLTWTDNADNERGFEIERSSGPSGPWSPLATVGENVRRYEDNAVSINQKWFYRVRSINGSASSDWSNIFMAHVYNEKPGRHWKRGYSEYLDTLYGVAWNGSKFVAVGENGIILCTSAVSSKDSRTMWSQQTSGTSQELKDVMWVNDKYFVVGDSVILTSDDGESWTLYESASYGKLEAIKWNGTQYVAVGNSAVVTSTDGVTWSVASNPGVALKGITWTGALFVAVGDGGAVVTSPDAITWTRQYSGVGVNLHDIAWSDKHLLAVGDRGVIMASLDGYAWIVKPVGMTTQLRSVTWTGSQWAAVGEGDVFIFSERGLNWAFRDFRARKHMYGITWSGSRLVAVGKYASIFTSIGRDTRVSSFDVWASEEAIAGGEVSAMSDEDGDGLVNLLEYAFNTDVRKNFPDEVPAVSAEEGGMMKYKFFRARDSSNATYTIEWSDDLIGWQVLTVNPGEPGEDVEVEVPADVFLRLRVDTP